MIVGTAGHVDHGKTLLIQRLTGVDTDRLAEEKRRGMTIDLGFAYLGTGDGRAVGFVDVPGHERFVRTMAAGAAGIDFALLAVAASEGVKPQTVEHVRILDLLGVADGIVALTKADLATASRIAEVERDLRRVLSGTSLAGIPAMPVSALTGAGVDALRDAILAAARDRAAPACGGALRMTIDRSFTLTGAGTILTGTIVSGAIAVGDDILVLPQAVAARVRSLHAQGREAPRAVAGERCALNIVGRKVEKDAFRRGDWAVQGEYAQMTGRFDAELRFTAEQPAWSRGWEAAQLHVGAADIPVRAVPLVPDSQAPGGARFAQFAMSRPLPLRPGDRFILRNGAAGRTIGGGRILDIRPPLRGRRGPERLALLEALRAPTHAGRLSALIARRTLVDFEDYGRDHMLLPAEAAAVAADVGLVLVSRGKACFATTVERAAALEAAIVARLKAHHAGQPDSPGLDLAALRRAVDAAIPGPAFAAFVLDLAGNGRLAYAAPWARLKGHAPALPPESLRIWLRARPVLARDPVNPPALGPLALAAGAEQSAVRDACRAMARRGAAVEIAGRFFLREAVARMALAAQDLARAAADGTFTVRAFCDRLGIGRNLAIEVLEYFDRTGATLRRGNARRVARDAAARYGAAETAEGAG